MMRSLYGKVVNVGALIPKSFGSGSGTSSTVDMQGFRSCMFVIMAGVFNLTTTNKVTCRMEESVDGTVWTEVAQADMTGSEGTGAHILLDTSASDASTVNTLYYRGSKRYAHMLFTEAGTVAIPLACLAVQSHQEMSPSVD